MSARRGRVNVVHLTSAHRGDDARIAQKECRSLADAGFQVTLLAPRAEGVAPTPGVSLIQFTSPRGRLGRVGISLWLGALKTMLQRPTVVHVHDPELMLLAPLFRTARIRFVFDAHEDFANDRLRGVEAPSSRQRLAAAAVRALERVTGFWCDAVVGVHDSYAARFECERYISVRNFPMPVAEPPEESRREGVVYTGGLAEDRFAPLLAEVGQARSNLGRGGVVVAGRLASPDLQNTWATARWGRYAGFLSRSELDALLRSSRVGLALLSENESRAALSTTKVYEYLAHGLPIVATRVAPWYREFGNSAAIRWVSRNEPEEILAALRELDDESAWSAASRAALQLGRSTTWTPEAERLIALYDELTSGPA